MVQQGNLYIPQTHMGIRGMEKQQHSWADGQGDGHLAQLPGVTLPPMPLAPSSTTGSLKEPPQL